MSREAPEPEQNHLLCRVELGSPLPVPDRQRSRTETLGWGQVGEVHVWFGGGTHHQAGERRRGPGQGHGAAFDWLGAAGKRSVEEQSAGVPLCTAGGLQREGLRGDERLLVHSFNAGRSEEQTGQSATAGFSLLLRPC